MSSIDIHLIGSHLIHTSENHLKLNAHQTDNKLISLHDYLIKRLYLFIVFVDFYHFILINIFNCLEFLFLDFFDSVYFVVFSFYYFYSDLSFYLFKLIGLNYFINLRYQAIFFYLSSQYLFEF